jgi:hypothetical protein
LCHVDGFEIGNFGFCQNSLEWLEVIFFRHQRAEPQALIGKFRALLDHARQKIYLTTRTPKFGI